ncbi:hypothetical protein [Nocardioides nanhaiensis]|uniref:CBM2 domain-containing protein n=1 Tax=Nocardioides nanhaiensis TaxID=1476871 RepID=A0ABP8VYB6_9ACTN
MKISTLTTGAVALTVGATLALGGPAVARHGSDDGPGDDRGRHHGGRGSDDRAGDDHGRRHGGRGSDDGPGDDRGRRHGGRGSDDDRSRGRGRHHGRHHDDDHRGRHGGRHGGRGGEDHHAGGARDDQRVESEGPCTGGARWELKAKDEDGGIEWEFEVDSNVSGQTWQVVVARNGQSVFSGPATTMGPSGSFSVEQTVADAPGTDTFVAMATFADQSCSGTVVYDVAAP